MLSRTVALNSSPRRGTTPIWRRRLSSDTVAVPMPSIRIFPADGSTLAIAAMILLSLPAAGHLRAFTRMRLRHHSAARDGGFAFFGKRGCQEHDFLRRIDSRKKHVAADAADRFGKRAVVLLDEQALD